MLLCQQKWALIRLRRVCGARPSVGINWDSSIDIRGARQSYVDWRFAWSEQKIE